MAKTIIDISMPLDATTPEWPGDTPFSYRLSVTKQQSGSVNIGELQTSTHIGTHIDAPFHYDEDGMKTDELPLAVYLTTAQVMDVTGPEQVRVTDLDKLKEGVEAVLLKTAAWQDRSVFPKIWPIFDPAIAEWLEVNGIRLLGVDVPSVDPETSKDLPMHHAMNRHGRFILEGIVLDDVTPGVYQLAALPLKIRGGEGSPVRAVLYK
ncbi:arylformamidase [Planococcus sp. ISL-109]|uniref:arylformamidase n=1 Tax=Planococcus sp. ISL-109 TaxID=2819166 RepID=UPI001BE7BF8B|nr:arylformamidase [Planococcus sp. ISL-109]MBT2584140.1 arylformamidase [Planococcus sp. ISL-109]